MDGRPALDTPYLSDKHFQRYWVHVEVQMTESKLKKLIDVHHRKNKRRYSKITDAHYFVSGRKLKKKSMSLLDAGIISFGPSRTVSQGTLKLLFADVQAILDGLDQKEKYDGDSGTSFLLPRNKFRFKGGFSLPITFGMDKNVTDRMGVAEVRGLQLVFDTSPIGLESAVLSVSDTHMTLGIETGFYSSALSGLVAQTFMQAKKIGNLFVEGGTN